MTEALCRDSRNDLGRCGTLSSLWRGFLPVWLPVSAHHCFDLCRRCLIDPSLTLWNGRSSQKRCETLRHGWSNVNLEVIEGRMKEDNTIIIKWKRVDWHWGCQASQIAVLCCNPFSLPGVSPECLDYHAVGLWEVCLPLSFSLIENKPCEVCLSCY